MVPKSATNIPKCLFINNIIDLNYANIFLKTQYLLNHLADLDNQGIVGKLLVSTIRLNNHNIPIFLLKINTLLRKLKLKKKIFFDKIGIPGQVHEGNQIIYCIALLKTFPAMYHLIKSDKAFKRYSSLNIALP